MSDLINTGTIGDRLGVKIPASFITDTLGIEPTSKDKRALLFTEDQFQEICSKMQDHIAEAAEKDWGAIGRAVRAAKPADDDEL